MDYLDQLILETCKEPVSSGEIAKKLALNRRTLSQRLKKLDQKGAIKVVLTNNTRHNQGRLYCANDTKHYKPYQPLGMCIMGVWL